MKRLGGTVLAITTDPPEKSKQVVDRYKLSFDILSDADAKTITAYGLLFHEPMGRGDIALPANFLIDQAGKIVWRYLSTHVQDRADPAEVLEEVRKLTRRA